MKIKQKRMRGYKLFVEVSGGECTHNPEVSLGPFFQIHKKKKKVNNVILLFKASIDINIFLGLNFKLNAS